MNKIEQKLENLLEPSKDLIQDMKSLDGDILILGVGGKIGPSLARLAKKAIDQSGKTKRVIGVSRFTQPGLKEELEKEGIETHVADLLDEEDLKNLPDVKNVLYLVGTKFGTTGQEGFTWAMNTYLPGNVAKRFKGSRIVVYSTGNIYPFTPIKLGGADESVLPEPMGEYAQSCLGRERVFEYFSKVHQTPLLIYRLNYANDLRYGVLLEIAKSVKSGNPIDLNMGHVNVIWQGDNNEMTLRSLLHCETPAKKINITGPETVSVRWIANEFGERLNKQPVFEGEEQPKALLSNAAESFKLFGYPKVSLKEMIDLTAFWLESGGEMIDKPTHFQEREGKF